MLGNPVVTGWPPAGDLQRCQPQRGQRAGGEMHADLGIEHYVRSILRYLIQPVARRALGPVRIDRPGPVPERLLVGDRTGVVDKDLELPPVNMPDDAAQDHVPYRVLPHLPLTTTMRMRSRGGSARRLSPIKGCRRSAAAGATTSP